MFCYKFLLLCIFYLLLVLHSHCFTSFHTPQPTYAVAVYVGCGVCWLRVKYKGCGMKWHTNNYLKYEKIIKTCNKTIKKHKIIIYIKMLCSVMEAMFIYTDAMSFEHLKCNTHINYL